MPRQDARVLRTFLRKRRIIALQAASPGGALRAEADWAPVDLERDRPIDIAIRRGPEPRCAATAVPLLRERFRAYAAPALLAGLDLGELAPSLEVAWRSQSLPPVGWAALATCEGTVIDHFPMWRVFSDETMAIQAAITGQGALLLSDVLARDAVAQGWLVPRRGDVIAPSFTYSARSTPTRLVARKTRRAWTWLQAMACECEAPRQCA